MYLNKKVFLTKKKMINIKHRIGKMLFNFLLSIFLI